WTSKRTLTDDRSQARRAAVLAVHIATWLQTKRRPIQIRATPTTNQQVTGHPIICGSRSVYPDVRFWSQRGADGLAGGPDTGQQSVKQLHRGHWRQRGALT